jgi:flagellar biosynthesis/type III secretory pathway protein FliH
MASAVQQLRQNQIEKAVQLGMEQFKKLRTERGLELSTKQALQLAYDIGFQQGFDIGFQLGLQQTLLRLLRVRFGPLDAAVETRIAKADADALDRWAERVLVAQRIDDLFDDE